MQHFAALATALLASLCAVNGRTTRGIGAAADISEAPWLVQFDYADENGQFYGAAQGSCSGSIIDSTHILTAQHCLKNGYDKDPSRLMIRAGATKKTFGGDLYTVKSVATHPQAGGTHNGAFDLAVLTLNEPLKFSDTVQPIEIASKPIEDGTSVTGGGWGRNNENDETSYAPGLQTYALKKLAGKECRWRLAAFNEESKNSLMCMVPEKKNGGIACGGDSGSGVWLPAAGDKPAQLVGVLSSGTVCDVNDEKATNNYVDILNMNVRGFLSQFFNMSGKTITVAAPKDAPAGPPEFDLMAMFKEIAEEEAKRPPVKLTDLPEDVFERLGLAQYVDHFQNQDQE